MAPQPVPTPRSSFFAPPARRLFLTLLAYTMLTAAMLWPVLAAWGTAIPGSEGDAWNHLWTFWWVKKAIFSGTNPFYTPLLYYPAGVSLQFHNIAWLHILFWIPLQAILGGGPAYTVLFLGNFVANAFATYLLARELTHHEAAAFVAGLVAGFWPYTLSHHNHPNLILIAGLPLTLLFLHRTLATGQTRPALAAGLSMAFLGLTRWQLLLMSAPFIGLFTLYRLVTQPQSRSRAVLSRLVLAGGGAGLLLLPMLLPLLMAQLSRTYPEDLFVADAGQTDLWAYLLPNRYHPLWGEAVFGWYGALTTNKVYVPFVGYSTLLLAGIGLVRRGRETWFWLLLALLVVALALGTTLHINGQSLGALPWGWLHNTFLLQLVRNPDRFNVLLSVPVALLVAWGLTGWRERGGKIAAAGFALLILFEYSVTYPTLPLATPAWYTQIAQDNSPFAILDLPLDSRSYDKEYMYYQISHQHPLVTGHVSRLPREAFTFIESVPLLNGLTTSLTPTTPDVASQLALLAEAGVRYVVLHKKYLDDAAIAEWRHWFTVPAQYEDEALLVYATAPDFDALPVVATLGGAGSIAPVVAEVAAATVLRPALYPGDSLDVALSWRPREIIPAAASLCFYLLDGQETSQPLGCQAPSDILPGTTWPEPEGGLVHTNHTFALESALAVGTYRLAAAFQPTPTPPTALPTTLATVTLYPAQPLFTAPTAAVAAAFTWDDTIRLVGYDLYHDQELTLTLYWQALQQPPQAYKIFLHLIDATTGQLAAQADYMPQNWNYPTNLWQNGEYVLDRVTLPLANVPTGTYVLKLGLYDPNTTLRLPVGFPDEAAVLTEIVLEKGE